MFDSHWPLVFVLEPLIQLVDALCKQCWRLAALAALERTMRGACWHRRTARGLYLLGTMLWLGGAGGEMAANNVAPQAIVSSLGGALAIMWLIVLSPCLLGEKLTVLRLGCAAVLVLGTALVGVFAPRSERTASALIVDHPAEVEAVVHDCHTLYIPV